MRRSLQKYKYRLKNKNEVHSNTIIVLVDACTVGYKFAGTYIAVCMAESMITVANNHLKVYHIYRSMAQLQSAMTVECE